MIEFVCERAEPVVLRSEDGSWAALEVDRWHEEPTGDDLALLDHVVAPVLDVGCGPGRLVDALNGRGVAVLGVDISSVAVKLTRAKGAPAVRCSIFDSIPAAGSWGSALLLDGNVGIGGDPRRLLRRLRDVLAPEGRILVEFGSPGTVSSRLRARLERRHGVGSWFDWAVVGIDDARELAKAVGMVSTPVAEGDGRWFACLTAS